jgi:hypothetical protein
MMSVSNKEPAGTGGHTMHIDITWKLALPALVGLFVIATVVMNSSAVARSSTESRPVTRSGPASSVCDILYPVRCSFVQPW